MAWKRARIEGTAVATNTPPNGAFRGFGAPQTIWAIERHMDRLAARLGEDPLHFKRRSALSVGAVTVTGPALSESVGVDECVVKARPRAATRRSARRMRIHPRPPASQARRGVA